MKFLAVFLIAILFSPIMARAGNVSSKEPDTMASPQIAPQPFDPVAVESVQAKVIKDDNPDASGLPKDNHEFLKTPSESDMPDGDAQAGNYVDPNANGFNDPSEVVVEAGPKRIHVNKLSTDPPNQTK